MTEGLQAEIAQLRAALAALVAAVEADGEDANSNQPNYARDMRWHDDPTCRCKDCALYDAAEGARCILKRYDSASTP